MSENQFDAPDNVDVIDDHLEKFFSDKEIVVMHEIMSETVHSDVFIIKPNKRAGRNYYILFTCGLSALPMNTPEGYEEYQYAEIVMLLPSSWKMKDKDLEDPNNWWPFRLLKELTKYPHEENTWLGFGHTFSWGLEEYFSDNNQFVGVVLVDSINLPEELLSIQTTKHTIHIYSAIPLYKEELEFKLEHGVTKLLEKFDAIEVDEIVDINRANICA